MLVALLRILGMTNSLQGARHAALGTLYSLARRIGMGGVSCLLNGLRKKISFAFSVVAPNFILNFHEILTSSLGLPYVLPFMLGPG